MAIKLDMASRDPSEAMRMTYVQPKEGTQYDKVVGQIAGTC